MSYLGSFLRPLTFATLPHTIVAIAATALMLPRRRYLNRKDNKNMRRVTHRDGVEYHWVGKVGIEPVQNKIQEAIMSLSTAHYE